MGYISEQKKMDSALSMIRQESQFMRENTGTTNGKGGEKPPTMRGNSKTTSATDGEDSRMPTKFTKDTFWIISLMGWEST